MRATERLWQHALRVTLFSRPNCSLCVDAKEVLSKVWDKRHFEYREMDVMRHKRWKDLYEFDVPVVHFDRKAGGNEDFETTAQARKLMHRINETEVQSVMDEVEKAD
ncbi:hypothetical protein BAUCODRAFT_62285 [Baudoinia panamericana UAMH 10762]|uniref:Glutaredoxin-like protein n=1 Tax=Baudoinia panamericana (strain UAMH 10762) TaxID=717646 RepID=M2NQ45_BAUPA|nr:uncharacterized protein BAUCODRAFT_62285 [Baudoinia panamericana UAMH 10762]EMD01141.1 hypothetical protein BAUCODRAFT_62285 [Baudoinia panamericana UAMH 10762]